MRPGYVAEFSQGALMQRQTAAEPAVSVVIPAYRASRDIVDALDSVFQQTCHDVEVLVVNDGSPDTDELEIAIARFRHRIRYIAQENRGAGAARNAAIALARGRYVAFLDADDRWLPEFLARQVAFLDAHAEVGLVYTDAFVSGESPLAGRRFMEKAPSCGTVTLESLIAQRCNIILSTVVMRRGPLLDAGGFDETLRRGQDFDLWLRLSFRGVRMAYQRVVLAERRARADGLSGDSVAEIRRALDVLQRFAAIPGLPASARTALQARINALDDSLEIEHAKRRILEGNFDAARHHLSMAKVLRLKVRLARLGLRFAPRLLRLLYVRARQPTPVPQPAAARQY